MRTRKKLTRVLLICGILGFSGCVALYSFFSPEVHQAVKDQPNSWCSFWSIFDRPLEEQKTENSEQ
jgi:hypothetical protein